MFWCGLFGIDFVGTEQIFLEENYRTTGAILGAALAIVRQGIISGFSRYPQYLPTNNIPLQTKTDKTRINKSLKPTHPTGSSLVLHTANDALSEASYIATRIKHLIAHTGGMINYGDIAILLRYGALSRSVETALQKAGIPSRMVGGHKFFERAE